ncbi:MAG: hypothetical protein ACRBN8_36760 [Nannocystales bacterium]
MNGASRYVVWGAASLLVGCFSDPPTVNDAGGDTGSSTSSQTSLSPTSGETSQTDPTVTDATSSSTAADSGSSGTTTTGDSTGAVESSEEGPASESTDGGGCAPGQVEVDGTCLSPLEISSAFSVSGIGGPFNEGTPCLSTSCGPDLPLSGGFEVDNVDLHSSAADFEAGSWDICGASAGNPDAWNVFARCAVAEGDLLTVTEVEVLDDDAVVCVDAGCPMGTSLVGGGGRWGSNFALTASQPTLDGHWEVCGRGLGGAPQVEVDATCAVLPVGASIQLVEVTEPVELATVDCAQAACKAGLAIAGGGNGGTLAATLEVSRAMEDGQAWMACGRANFSSGQIRARVLCYEP